MRVQIVLGIPRFRQDYGDLFHGQYVVSASLQLFFAGGSLVGFIIGGVATGLISKKWGRQLSMFVGYCKSSHLCSFLGV